MVTGQLSRLYEDIRSCWSGIRSRLSEEEVKKVDVERNIHNIYLYVSLNVTSVDNDKQSLLSNHRHFWFPAVVKNN